MKWIGLVFLGDSPFRANRLRALRRCADWALVFLVCQFCHASISNGQDVVTLYKKSIPTLPQAPSITLEYASFNSIEFECQNYPALRSTFQEKNPAILVLTATDPKFNVFYVDMDDFDEKTGRTVRDRSEYSTNNVEFVIDWLSSQFVRQSPAPAPPVLEKNAYVSKYTSILGANRDTFLTKQQVNDRYGNLAKIYKNLYARSDTIADSLKLMERGSPPSASQAKRQQFLSQRLDMYERQLNNCGDRRKFVLDSLSGNLREVLEIVPPVCGNTIEDSVVALRDTLRSHTRKGEKEPFLRDYLDLLISRDPRARLGFENENIEDRARDMKIILSEEGAFWGSQDSTIYARRVLYFGEQLKVGIDFWNFVDQVKDKFEKSNEFSGEQCAAELERLKEREEAIEYRVMIDTLYLTEFKPIFMANKENAKNYLERCGAVAKNANSIHLTGYFNRCIQTVEEAKLMGEDDDPLTEAKNQRDALNEEQGKEDNIVFEPIDRRPAKNEPEKEPK